MSSRVASRRGDLARSSSRQIAGEAGVEAEAAGPYE